MRYRELLNVLMDINEKTPTLLDQQVEYIFGVAERIEPVLTLGANQKLYFIGEGKPGDAS